MGAIKDGLDDVVIALKDAVIALKDSQTKLI